MPAVYPRAHEAPPAAPPFDENLCAAEIITLREARPTITRQLAAGKIIHAVGGRVEDVYRVWDEIEAERLAMEAVPLQTEAVYVEEISKVGLYLNPLLWVAGMKAKLGVSEIVVPEEV